MVTLEHRGNVVDVVLVARIDEASHWQVSADIATEWAEESFHGDMIAHWRLDRVVPVAVAMLADNKCFAGSPSRSEVIRGVDIHIVVVARHLDSLSQTIEGSTYSLNERTRYMNAIA